MTGFADKMQELVQAGENDGTGIYPGSIVTGWVLAYEVLDPEDGQRGMGVRVSPSITPWTMKGLLHEALNADNWSYAQDDDEDDD